MGLKDLARALAAKRLSQWDSPKRCPSGTAASGTAADRCGRYVQTCREACPARDNGTTGTAGTDGTSGTTGTAGQGRRYSEPCLLHRSPMPTRSRSARRWRLTDARVCIWRHGHASSLCGLAGRWKGNGLEAIEGAGRFLDQWGHEAAAYGWTPEQIFGRNGLAFALRGGTVRALGRRHADLDDGRSLYQTDSVETDTTIRPSFLLRLMKALKRDKPSRPGDNAACYARAPAAIFRLVCVVVAAFTDDQGPADDIGHSQLFDVDGHGCSQFV